MIKVKVTLILKVEVAELEFGLLSERAGTGPANDKHSCY